MSTNTKQLRAERAAAALKEQERREKRRRVLSIVGVLGAIVVIVAGGFLVNTLRDNSDEVAASAPPTGSEYGLTIGPADAPHKVVIYEDFLCPFCGELEAQSHEQLEQLADAGKVQVEYRPFEWLGGAGDYSGDATEAFGSVLTQSGDETALKFHDLLFSDQPSESGPFPSTDDLADLMTQAGADDAAVAYFKDGKAADWAEQATKTAVATGLKGTPTIVLDGQPFTQGASIDDIAANLVKAVS